MAVTYGFFNSVNGDRKYNAEQMSEYFRGIVNEGVFQHLDGGLAVTAGTGLAVSVASGRAIIQNRWVQNSDAMTLSISAASETYARKDAVVVRLNYSTRSIEIAVKAGTPAASPVAPSMTRNSTTYEMALAYVNVAANATSVTITDKRSDSTVCGWATVAQSTSGEVDAQLNAMKTGFDGVVYSSPAAMVQGCDNILMSKIDMNTELMHYGSFERTEFIQGARTLTNPYVINTNANKISTKDVFHLYAGDTISASNIASGHKIAIAGTNGYDSGWKTSDFTYTATEEIYAFVVEANNDQQTAIVPSSSTTIVTVTAYSSIQNNKLENELFGNYMSNTIPLKINSLGQTIISGVNAIAGHKYRITVKSSVNVGATVAIGLGYNGQTNVTSDQLYNGFEWIKDATVSNSNSRIYITQNSGSESGKVSATVEDLTINDSNFYSLSKDVGVIYDTKKIEPNDNGFSILSGFSVDAGDICEIYIKSDVYPNMHIVGADGCELGLGYNGGIRISNDQVYNGFTFRKQVNVSNDNCRVYITSSAVNTSANFTCLLKIIKCNMNFQSVPMSIQNMKYIGMYNGNKHTKFTLGFITDIHGDASRFKRFCSLMDHYGHTNGYSYFDLAVCGGDIIHYSLAETDGARYNEVATGGTTWYKNMLKNFDIPFLPTTGNHDQGWGTNAQPDIVHSLTNEQVHDTYLAGTVLENQNKLPYGYYDNSTYKIRIISLYNFDSKIMEKAEEYGWSQLPALRGGATLYSQEQLDWFAATLNSTPANYTVIILSHTAPIYRTGYIESCSDFTDANFNDRLNIFEREAYPAQGWRNSDSGGMGVIADIVQAYIDRGTINETYSYQGSMFFSSGLTYWSDVTANYDFSNSNGIFAGYLCGHFHMDGILQCTMEGYTTQKLFMFDTSSIENNQRLSSLPRIINTDTMDCLTGLVVDTGNRKINIVRLGSSFDIYGTEKSYASISY